MKKPNKSSKSSRSSKPTKIPNIDPTTVATIWHSMQTICKEMRHMVKRTAQNYLIGQLQDMSVGIWGAWDCRCNSSARHSQCRIWSRCSVATLIPVTYF